MRAEQFERFAAVAAQRFENDALRWARESWPEEYEARGEEAARAEVRSVIEHCRVHGIERVEHVLRYLNLSYALGPEFESTYPWAESVLEGAASDPDGALDALERQAERVLDAGED